MQTEIRFAPAFAVIHAQLEAGDVLLAEAGSMASMSGNCAITTRWNGGFFSAWARKLFGGETLFMNELRSADGKPAEVTLTQPTPGDITKITLKGHSICLTSGSFIACEPTVNLSVRWAGIRSWWSGEGLFRLVVSGSGQVWFGGYGGCIEREVDGTFVVDSGHLLAYEPTVALKVGLAGGIFSSFFGGEGFVSRMQGRGRIWLQSRSLDGLAHWTNGHLR